MISLNLQIFMRSFRHMIALAIIVLSVASVNAHAQAAKGQKEFAISGDIFVPVKNTQSTTGLVSFDISRYFTRRVQAGLGSTFNFFADTTENYSSTGVVTGTTTKLAVTSDPNVFVRYNFIKPKNPFAPYVGIEAGTSIQSDGNTSQFQDNFYIRPNVGLKYYFSKRAAFDWNGGYQAVVKDSSNGTADFRVGISVLF